MDEKLKAMKGELNEKDLAAAGISQEQLAKVSGGTDDGAPAEPENPDGTLEKPDSQEFVWLNSD